jgi:hypothetical protein
MKEYNIVITNTEEKNDFSTQEYYTEEGTAESLMEIVRQAVGFNGALKFSHGDRYITIEDASDEGYMYEIYSSRQAYEDGDESIDGGQCTGTLSSAIEMAIN